ncbi:MAG: hypothetical protein RRA92_10915 [Gemmatimonadota bacterium]|nr:hypothetical protein [Gemmatimonadota bacterium]
MHMTAQDGIHFLGLLMISAMLVGVSWMFVSCAWCAWRDRWTARHQN